MRAQSLIAATLLAAACGAPAQKNAAKTTTPTATNASVTPVDVGIDITALDPAAKPCDDFFQYACGGWLKRTEIPADKTNWVRSFSVIDADNETHLRALLDDAANGKTPAALAGPNVQKVGDLWQTCMDEPAVEQATPAVVKELFARIDAIKDEKSLIKALAHIHLDALTHGRDPMFAVGATQDFTDATQMIGELDRSGMGLPDRDYYLKQDDARMKTLREQYQKHVEKMLTLAGEKAADAATAAKVVMTIETELAKASLPRVDRRDPHKIYHRINLDGIAKIAPHIDWKLYFAELGHADITQINVTEPEFFKALDQMVAKSVTLADWKTYLKWWAVHDGAQALSKAFVDENFDFYSRLLAGAKQIRPRWKRCVGWVDQALGQAAGQLFVKSLFPDASKTETKEIVVGIEKAFENNLGTLAWMDEATKKASAEKLAQIANQIGYPDVWRDYAKLEIKRGPTALFDNLRRAAAFEAHRDLAKVGKPVDRNEWHMTPPQVNAYYDSSMNMMVFPAGILQGAFYNPKAHRAVNYGAIGMVMGHELTHGFDDEGRQFDGKGNLRDWWSKASGEEFVRRADCVANQYSGYSPIDDKHLNGKLTLGENIADIGGIRIAHAAYVAQRGGPPTKVAGTQFTDEQLFWLGYAQAWCGKRRDEEERMRVMTDPHSPPRFRVNGPLSDSADFATAFQCAPGSPMAPKNACTVW